MMVKEKQNTQELLEKQYVARHCYNAAEWCGALAWLSCIVVTIIAVKVNDNREFVVYLVALLTISECVFDSIRQLYIKWGAAFKMYFDDVLFEFEEREYYVEYSLNQLNCIAEIIVKLHKKTCQKQISHSGTDKYRGVRDWYTSADGNSRQETIYLCQNENQYFDKIITSISFTLLIILFVLGFAVVVKADEKGTIICTCTALAIKMIKSIVNICKYFSCQKRTEFLRGQIEASQYELSYIQKLQENINYRRQLNVVSFSVIHNLISDILHKFNKNTHS